MTLPIDVATAAVAAIKAAMPELREVKQHPGKFDYDDLQRWLVNTPAVRVALIGITGFESNPAGYIDAACVYAAVALADTKGQRELPGASAAANIVAALAVLIDDNDFGLETAFPAKVMRADNLFGKETTGSSMAIWGLTWSQVVRLGKDEFGAADLASGGVVPTKIYVGQSPAIGAANADAYVDVQTGEAPDV